MFCPNCGKEIPEGAGFCPSCGGKVSGSTSDTMKDTLKKASKAVTSTAKNAGKRVNEATNGKAVSFAQTAKGKAKETAQNFTADIKQATQDKDAKGFLTKNKFRNTKIIAGIILVVLIFSIFSGGGNGKFKNVEDKSRAFTSALTDVKKVRSSDIELKAYEPNSKGYMLWVSVDFTNTDGENGTALYLIAIDKDGNITSSDPVDIILPQNKSKLKQDIKDAKDFVKSKGMKIK